MQREGCRQGDGQGVRLREGPVHDYRKFLQEFEEFRIRARHLFEERAGAVAGDGPANCGEWAPPVDVFETADRIVLTAEIAGVRLEDVSIEALGTVLTLRGVRSPGRAALAAETCLRLEIPSGRFERSFALPCPVASEEVEAVLRDGVLTVTVPRRGAPQGRQIAVEAG
jgi:HSP20 family protein